MENKKYQVKYRTVVEYIEPDLFEIANNNMKRYSFEVEPANDNDPELEFMIEKRIWIEKIQSDN